MLNTSEIGYRIKGFEKNSLKKNIQLPSHTAFKAAILSHFITT